MLIIRLARRGRKGQAFFDLVAAEKSRPVQKKFIAKLGHFNPLSDGGKGTLVYDKSLVEKYINNGAQCSQAVARLLVKNGCELAGKFIKTRPTKPKKTEPPKEEVEETPAEPAAEASNDAEPEAPTEEPKAEEAETKEEAPAETPDAEKKAE